MKSLSLNAKYFLGLLVLNIILHFAFLSSPKSVVFDEVHFGKFVSAYCCTSENFFDIHPPHAKLLLSASAKLGGYNGEFGFKNIGDTYENVPIGWLRAFPAIWGTLLPPILFFLLLQIGATLAAATLGALLITLDNAFLIQTRIMALDGLLLVSLLLSILFYLKSEKSSGWKMRIIYWILTGCSAGMAMGTKFTGLIAPAVLLVITVDRLKFTSLSSAALFIRKWIWMGSSLVGTYLLGWFIHFQLLSLPGTGDQFYKNRGNFFEDLVLLHKVMFKSNAGISTPHSHSSQAWTWPFDFHPIYYWSTPGRDIYFFGNPFVWIVSSLFLAGFIVHSLLKNVSDLRSPKKPALAIKLNLLFVGYLIAYLPYLPISRPLFLYHYLPPLIFAILICVLWLDQIGFTKPGSLRAQRKEYFGFLGFVFAGFLLLMPLTYGLPKTHFWGDLIFNIVPLWR